MSDNCYLLSMLEVMYRIYTAYEKYWTYKRVFLAVLLKSKTQRALLVINRATIINQTSAGATRGNYQKCNEYLIFLCFLFKQQSLFLSAYWNCFYRLHYLLKEIMKHINFLLKGHRKSDQCSFKISTNFAAHFHFILHYLLLDWNT